MVFNTFYKSTKIENMKKAAAWMILGLLLTSGLMACGAAHGGNCDAYSSVDSTEINSDLASK